MDSRPSSLRASFDDFGDFDASFYFVSQYDRVPSKLSLYVDAPSKKENFERANGMLLHEELALETLWQKWRLAQNKNADPEEDYVNYRFYRSANYPLCLDLEASGDQITLNIFYALDDTELEGLLLRQSKNIRNEFATAKSPVFRVLVRSRDGGFATDKVNLDRYELDLEKNYNDDFRPVDQDIRKALDTKRSGLILLHGVPGTGKTSYIKSLITAYPTLKFIFVPNDFVAELLQPNFITFLVRQRNALLVIEDAEKTILARDGQGGGSSVVSTILQLTDGLFSDYLNLKVICTFNTDLSRIDRALFRKGRLVAFYEFGPLAEDKTKRLLPEADGPKTLAEIFHANDREIDNGERKIGFR